MEWNLKGIRELSGELTSLRGKGVVEIEHAEIDRDSAAKIAEVVHTGDVKRNNQDIHFSSIMIKKEHNRLFQEGQSIWKDNKVGDFIFSSEASHPERFSGRFYTLICKNGDEQFQYACEIQIGSIEFVLGSQGTEIDDVYMYSNVRATIFPYGNYGAKILGE